MNLVIQLVPSNNKIETERRENQRDADWFKKKCCTPTTVKEVPYALYGGISITHTLVYIECLFL